MRKTQTYIRSVGFAPFDTSPWQGKANGRGGNGSVPPQNAVSHPCCDCLPAVIRGGSEAVDGGAAAAGAGAGGGGARRWLDRPTDRRTRPTADRTWNPRGRKNAHKRRNDEVVVRWQLSQNLEPAITSKPFCSLKPDFFLFIRIISDK